MSDNSNRPGIKFEQFLTKIGLGMKGKLIVIFLVVQALPFILLTIVAWRQIETLGDGLSEIAVEDASAALNDSAVENIERMSTDTAKQVAAFLYGRDDDILYLSGIEPDYESYRKFCEAETGKLVDDGTWTLSEDGSEWVQLNPPQLDTEGGVSRNVENNDMDGFHFRPGEIYPTKKVPVYDEIVFIDLNGVEQIKYVTPNSTKINYPLSTELADISIKENTYIKAENYFDKLKELEPGEIYVSDVIGAYVGSNYIGMYTPDNVEKASADRGYDIDYNPESQSYAGVENPNGQRFEGIVRWATPVTDDNGEIIGYVSFALNHDHLMSFTDHITPMKERYTQLPNAYEGNYAFIWDYNCRSICHPRHHSIVGYDPETGEPQIPWLEASIYEGWQESEIENWTGYVEDYPEFYEQSRSKKPAAELTKAGLVGLDGRYLNNAPQCIGWMDLTGEGGSGSFYILWSGIYKLNTAAAIPYYTGQYAPSEENDYSRRGFGFVAIGSGLEDFTGPARDMETRLTGIIGDNQQTTFEKLAINAAVLLTVAIIIAIVTASSITGRIKKLVAGVSRFRAGERQFRYNEPVKDEFGLLADSFDDMADSIVDSVKNPLSITDMNGNVIYMNEAGLEYCRKTLDEIVNTKYSDSSIYPANTEYDPILALENGAEAEVYYLENIGRYLKATANYLLDKSFNRIGYIIETVDITDMILEQMRIEEQNALLDVIYSASPDLIWYMDSKGAYYTVNPRFASIIGLEPSEFTGKRGEDVFPEDIAKGFAENDLKAINASKPLYSEEYLKFADGHDETLDSVRTPIYDTSGALVGLLGFARNVSTRVHMEEELRKTQIELEKAVNEANKANAHKGDFLARMSHEIRTPMNAIIGLTNIVQKKLENLEGDDSDLDLVKGHIDKIDDSSQHLLGLLNDILDLSKIDAGRIELTDEVVELSHLIETVENIIRPRCSDKKITFNVNCDEFKPSTFSLDSLRLRQVLINLLGNAVKFTPELGNIDFSVTQLEKRNNELLINFSVKDSGIGVADEYKEEIFESFEQGRSDVSKNYGGTGLGLAISKRIVQLFGGEIKLESEIGKGSEFHFAIWLKQTAAEEQESKHISNISEKFSGKRILLVDDVDINRLIVTSMLEDTGIIIDEAGDGLEALEKFKSSKVGQYDIILMDVRMPKMDGYEASMEIRSLDRADAKTIPIIAQTANAFKEDMDRAIAQGMNGHLSKPIEIADLLAVLTKYLS